MKIQKQKYRHDPDNGVFGDCYRTCVAMLLDLDRDDVPHFSKDADLDQDGIDATQRLREWLKPRGLSTFIVLYPDEHDLEEILQATASMNPGLPMMLVGESKRYAGIGHVVIIQDGKILADPSDSGIKGPINGYYWVEIVCILNGRALENWTDQSPKNFALKA